jgi:succinyl-diaminopimelate desuccinylase
MSEPAFLQLARQFLSIESTADRPVDLGRALQLVEDLVAKVPDVQIERFEQNGKPSFLAYCGKKRPKRFHVLLNGHVDVVPGRPEDFQPYEQNGNFFGRGALDMKIAALVLAEVFCELAPKVDYPLGLQIVADEEVGGANGTGYQVTHGVTADFVIAGEFTPPSAICAEMRGICTCEVMFQGVAAHAAYPWKGKNAVLEANEFAAKLLQIYPLPTSDKWVTTANVAAISTSNTTFNRVPDNAVLKLDIRYVPGDTRFKNREAAQKFLQELNPAASVNVLMFEPSHQADTSGEMVTKLAAALQQTTGTKTTFVKKHGGADVRFYSEVGTQAVTLGLQGDNLHGDNEFVELASIPQYKQTLVTFLRNLTDSSQV